MSSLIHKKIEEANQKFSLLGGNNKILVALSGGADSVALLISLKMFYPAVDVYACHVNHSLRADESDQDAEFVRELCKQNEVELDFVDVKKV